MGMTRKRSVYVGFDTREVDAFAVACHSVASKTHGPISLHGLVLQDLRDRGLYYRPTEQSGNCLIDVLSKRDDYDGAISTEFAIGRFLVPHLAVEGLAMFIDADFLARGDVAEVFDAVERDAGKAVYCVKHDHRPAGGFKMDGQKQTKYQRKNWSSMMVFDCDHPANKALTVELINSVPGRDLHAFCWLDDEDIGELGPEWNYLVGYTKADVDPRLVHFTEGVPSHPGHSGDEHADEWRTALNKAALGALGFGG